MTNELTIKVTDDDRYMLTMMIRHLARVEDIAELKHVFRSHDRAEPAY